MVDGKDPFADIDPAAPAGEDPFAQFDETPGEKYLTPQSSWGGAAMRGGERSVVPAAGGLVGAGAGAEAGAGLGALLGSPAGPAGATVGGAIGGFVGGAAGMFGGAYLLEQGQDWALKQLPDSWTDALGMSDRQRRLDEAQHPVASFIGGSVPYLVTMKPNLSFKATELPANATAMQRIAANPVTQKLFGGAMMGGFEVGSELAQGEFDWRKAAIATGFGLVFNKPNRLGESLTEVGARPVRAPGEAVQRWLAPAGVGERDFANMFAGRPVTVAEAGARGVMGPGITEEVYSGAHLQDPTAQMLADEQHRQEMALLYGPYERDIHEFVRHTDPELFEQYDRLQQQRDELTGWLRRAEYPAEEAMRDLRTRETELQGQLDSLVAGRGGYTGGPEARRLRAMIRDVQADRDAALQARSEAFGPENPETAAIRRAHGEVDAQMRDLAQQVSAAYRRGEEHLGRRPVVEPPEAEPEAAPQPSPAPSGPEAAAGPPTPAAAARILAAAKPVPDQKKFIADDVTRQLVAAGRPIGEAKAAGALIAERYAARAARFKGARGTAEELYRQEGAKIVGEGRQAPPVAAASVGPQGPASGAPPQREGAAPAAPVEAAPAIPERYRGWKIGDAVEVGPIKGLMVREVLPDGFILEGQRNSFYRFKPPEKAPKESKSGLEMLEYVERLPDGERPPELPPAEPEPPKSFADELSEEVERIWAANPQWSRTSTAGINPKTGKPRRGNRQGVARQEGAVNETARYNVMMREAGDVIADYLERNVIREDQLGQLAKDYRRGADETPGQAFERALDRIDIREERETTEGIVAEDIGDTLFQERQSGQSPGEAGALKALMDGAGADPAKDLADLGKRIAESAQTGGLIGGESTVSMMNEMRGAILKNGEVLDSIVRFVPVDMVHDLFGTEAAAKVAFHQEAMLKDGSAFDAQLPVSALSERARAVRLLIGEVAREGAERRSVALGSAGEAPERSPTQGTDEVGRFYQGKKLRNASITLGTRERALIRLTATADASSFLHETGHDFLEQLRRDAAHEQAPADLRDDWDTVLNWLGVKSGEDIKTRHHEKFATGFEQYLREGRAPSSALADVFAKFKDWLMNIYQTLKGLGAPINDDIRGVFDRMLAAEPERTVIAPERERPPSMADIQERDARETEPVEAPAVADRIAAERQVVTPPPEVAREIQPIIEEVRTASTERGGEAGEGAEGGAAVGGGGAAAGTEPGGGGVAEGNAAVGAGGGETAAQGPSVSGGGGPARGAGSANEPPLAPRPIERYGADDSPFVDKAGNIRLELLTNEEDLRQAIRDSAAANNDFLGERQGVVTDAEVDRLAEEMGFSGALSAARRARVGQAFNAVEVRALRNAVVESARRVNASMKNAAREGAGDDAVLAFAEATQTHRLLQGVLSGATAEAGRALRAFRDMTGGEADDISRAAMGKTLFQMRTIAKLGSKLESAQQIGKLVDDMGKRSFGRMVLEYWINGLISGIATHSTYTVGNTILSAEKMIFETGAAAAIGRVREMMGREGDRVHLGEVGAQLRGAARGYVPAVHATIESLRTGVTTMLPNETRRMAMPFQPGAEMAEPAILNEKANMQDVLASSYGMMRGLRDAFVVGDAAREALAVGEAGVLGTEYSPLGAIPDIRVGAGIVPLGGIARLPSRGVAAIHSFFRAMNYSVEINGQAYRKAMNEGLTGPALDARVAALRQNPTIEMMEAARHEATELTLMGQGNQFTQLLGRLMSTEVNLPLLGVTQPLKFIDPFVHISSNIIDQAIVQRTPVGAFFSQELRNDLMGKNGNIAQDKAQARMLVGTAFSLMVAGLASQGVVSGSGPSDPREAAMWRLAGNQAHSIRVGDFWYDTHRLGVMGMLFGIGADLYDVAHLANQGEFSEAWGHFGHAITQNVLDESFMRGPSEAIRAIEDHQGYGAVWTRNFAASFLPYSVLMSQTARAVDPYTREARDVADAMRQKIPYASMGLTPRYDVWGQEVPNRDVLFSAKGMLAIYATHANSDPVNRAMLQLGKFPAPVERKIRGVELTGEQHAEYARLAGRMAKSRLDVIINSPDWGNMSPEARSAVVDAQLRQSREVAAGYIMAKDPTIPGRAVLQKRQQFQDRIHRGDEYRD